MLDGVDLSVGSGELVTLLGPSGCGKTTLLRLIAGLATPDQGRVILAGADVTRTPPHRRSVGVVFQNYALFPHRDVGGNVGFGLTHKGLGKAALSARIGRALDLVQTGRFRDRRCRLCRVCCNISRRARTRRWPRSRPSFSWRRWRCC